MFVFRELGICCMQLFTVTGNLGNESVSFREWIPNQYSVQNFNPGFGPTATKIIVGS